MTGYFVSTLKPRTRRGTFDIETELRDVNAAAISATAADDAISFNPRAIESFKVCFAIGAYTSYSAGTAQWAIEVQISDAANGTFTTVGGSLIPVGAALETEIILSGAQCAIADDDAAYVRVKATKTGSPGSLSYGAWIVPS
jgi:hypothetical protein